ncbi:MAG: hypothetical protein LBR31_08920 [Desulfovibrio sp.]|jgi:hypothetical protein|nr:hypothetical protein [Desulfovibrio sp.]
MKAKFSILLVIAISCLICLVSCFESRRFILYGNNSCPQEQSLSFRHKVSITFPRQTNPVTFDGLLQLDGLPHKPVLRAVGLGTMGLTMFDMTIAKGILKISTIHPALLRMPHFKEHMALCLTSVYGRLLGIDADSAKPGQNQAEIDFSDEKPWPRNMKFKHNKPDYTVAIRLVEIQTKIMEPRR